MSIVILLPSTTVTRNFLFECLGIGHFEIVLELAQYTLLWWLQSVMLDLLFSFFFSMGLTLNRQKATRVSAQHSDLIPAPISGIPAI